MIVKVFWLSNGLSYKWVKVFIVGKNMCLDLYIIMPIFGAKRVKRSLERYSMFGYSLFDE